MAEYDPLNNPEDMELAMGPRRKRTGKDPYTDPNRRAPEPTFFKEGEEGKPYPKLERDARLQSFVEGFTWDLGAEIHAGFEAFKAQAGAMGKDIATQWRGDAKPSTFNPLRHIPKSISRGKKAYKLWNQAQQQFAKERPGADLGLKTLGGTVSSGPLGFISKVPQLAGAAGKLLTKAPRLQRTKQVARTGAEAGVLGTISGAGRGETLEERMNNAFYGGVIGTTAGAGTTALAKGTGWIGSLFTPQNITARTGEGIKTLLRAADLTPAQAVARLDRLRKKVPDATMTDVLEQAGVDALTEVRKMDPKLANRINRHFSKREADTPKRLKKMFNRFFGGSKVVGPQGPVQPGSPRPTVYAADKAGKAQRELDAGKIYDRVLSDPTKHTDADVSDIVHRIHENYPNVITTANKRIGMDRKHVVDLIPDKMDLAPGQVPSYDLNMAQMHNIKKGLDEIIDTRISTSNGAVTTETKVLMKARDDLLGWMDDVDPAYGKARSIWSSSKDMERARDYGRKVLTQEEPEAVKDWLASKNPAEIDEFLTGMNDSIQRWVSDMGIGKKLDEAVPQMFGTERTREILGHVLKASGKYKTDAQVKRAYVGLLNDLRMERNVARVNAVKGPGTADIADRSRLGGPSPRGMTLNIQELIRSTRDPKVAKRVGETLLDSRGSNRAGTKGLLPEVLSRDAQLKRKLVQQKITARSMDALVRSFLSRKEAQDREFMSRRRRGQKAAIQRAKDTGLMPIINEEERAQERIRARKARERKK